MKYIIYELVKPSLLKEVEPDGYHYKTTYKQVLEKLDVGWIEAEHPSLESAMNEVYTNKEKLKQKTLTILPVLSIDWEGEISEL